MLNMPCAQMQWQLNWYLDGRHVHETAPLNMIIDARIRTRRFAHQKASFYLFFISQDSPVHIHRLEFPQIFEALSAISHQKNDP